MSYQITRPDRYPIACCNQCGATSGTVPDERRLFAWQRAHTEQHRQDPVNVRRSDARQESTPTATTDVNARQEANQP